MEDFLNSRKTMTVGEMIEILSKVPPEAKFEVSIDDGAGLAGFTGDFSKIGCYYSSFSNYFSVNVGDNYS